MNRVVGRPKSSRKPSRAGRAYCIARLKIRHYTVIIAGRTNGLKPVRMHFVQACETSPSAGEKAVSWTLLTCLEIDNFEAAEEAVHFYQMRWRVEDFLLVLKRL